jgi:hypothetical protein
MSEIYIKNHKIISTKHGKYMKIITRDFDIFNKNIQKIESHGKN